MISTGREKKSRTAFLLSAVLILALCVLTAYTADYYYDLNDDVLIKDILAGVQTGTPTGYNIQMLYPIGVFIALFYYLPVSFPWYGLFLCICQWGSLFLIVWRCSALWQRRKNNDDFAMSDFWKGFISVLILCFAGVFIVALLWRELVFVQYTVVAAMLAGTGMFLLYTNETGLRTGAFWSKNIPCILLAILAFLIRSELLLLLLPFAGVAGLLRLIRELRERRKEAPSDFFAEEREIGALTICLRYLALAVIFAVGLIGSFFVHLWAYGSTEWQSFQRFFDARTEVYDFYGIPDYEEHVSFYESIGISQAEWKLLDNYNYGLNPEFTTVQMEQLAEYARNRYYEEHPWQDTARDAFWQYVHRLLPLPEDTIQAFQTDLPWNAALLLLYGELLLSGILYRRREILWQLPLLAVARTVSWGYVLFRGRVPERISHSLYFTELLLLLAVLCTSQLRAREGMRESRILQEQELRRKIFKREEIRRRLRWIVCMVLPAGLAAFLVLCIPASVNHVMEEQELRQQRNIPYEALQAYCMANEENYYFVDVYSTVDFSEKIFLDEDQSRQTLPRNYDIIGGWACKSPLAKTERPEWFVIRHGKDTAWLSELLQEWDDGTELELEGWVYADGSVSFPEEKQQDDAKAASAGDEQKEAETEDVLWDVYHLTGAS